MNNGPVNQGPGKYDSLCTLVREMAGADAVVLVVVNGERGSGMSVQVVQGVALDLPGTLEHIAAGIRNARV